MGVDQAFSEDFAADEWAVCAIGVDPEGVYYELETAVGHGYESMLDKIVFMDAKYKPRAIGLEKGGMQDTTHFYLNRLPQYRRIKPKIVPISHGNKSKEWRIMNALAEPMRMNQLWLNPESVELHKEMVSYRGPGPKARDKKLDGLSIAMATAKRPVRSAAVPRDVKNWDAKKKKSWDRETGAMVWS